jgi:microcystin degradation protein MlrC
MRIVIAGFSHETNTFAKSRADDAAFAHGGGFPPFTRGAAMFNILHAKANIPAAGFIAAALAANDEIVPVLWTAACPSGLVLRRTYERISDEIIDGIRAALPADAIYLDLHGAMVCEHEFCGESALLRRIRAITGPELPIIASLDLHANVSPLMLELADVCVGFRTYPHTDMAATGARCYQALLQRIEAGARLAYCAHSIPYLTPICWQSTNDQPAKRLYARLEEIERETSALLSFTMGFPAADIPFCGAMVWAHARDPEIAKHAANLIKTDVLAAEADFHGMLYEPMQAIAEAMALREKANAPVILADPQDNPGAGGNGDTTGVLRALVAADIDGTALGLFYDPKAALAAHAAGEGATISLALGGRGAEPDDRPFDVTAEVERLSDGQFIASGPYFGRISMNLGLSACLRIGSVRVAVVSERAQMADLEMFRFLGIEPGTASILAVKSAVHFRAAFEPIASKILTVIAPGAMRMRATDWSWRHLPRGLRLMPGGPAHLPNPETA